MGEIFLAGRILLGGYYLFSAIHHFSDTATLARYAASAGVPLPTLAVIVAGLLLAIAGVSLIYGISRIIRTLIYGIDVPGFESLIVSVMFLGGVQLICLGILGEYLWRTLDAARGRKGFLIRETTGDPTED